MSYWRAESTQLESTGALRLRFHRDGEYLSFADFLQALVEESELRQCLHQALHDAPYIAYRWETPPLTSSNIAREFECLLHDSPDLEVPADPTDFSAHFKPGEDVVNFENLGADALLIVPCPVSDTTNYSHIGAFHRSAPSHQVHALWQTVASSVLARVGGKPLWLSTAGGGVDWLHVRIDDRPKYYRHIPWRTV